MFNLSLLLNLQQVKNHSNYYLAFTYQSFNKAYIITFKISEIIFFISTNGTSLYFSKW